jgi:Phosphatidylinositol transfer protein
MAQVLKEYKIRIPFTLKEYRKGQRYILTKLTTSDTQILRHEKKEEPDSIITETHKVLHLKNIIPSVIRKVIPDDACTVDEYSTNIEANVIANGIEEIKTKTHMKNVEGTLADLNINEDSKYAIPKENKAKEAVKDACSSSDKSGATSMNSNVSVNSCTTVYKNRYFDSDTFSLEVKTILSQEQLTNPFKITEKYKERELDFREYKDERITKVGDRDYEGNWNGRYAEIFVYKMVDVKVNSYVLGWIAKEVDKKMRQVLLEVHGKIVETYDEWKDLSEEALVLLEKNMIEKFLAK